MLVHREALGSKGYRLIKPHVLANDGGFSNDHACAVIDEKAPADLRARMNFNAGRRMSDFGDHAGNQRSAQAMQLMGEPVMRDGGNAGITYKYLVYASGGWISLIGCLDVALKQAADVWQPSRKCLDNGGSLFAIGVVGGIGPRNKAQFAAHLYQQIAQGHIKHM